MILAIAVNRHYFRLVDGWKTIIGSPDSESESTKLLAAMPQWNI